MMYFTEQFSPILKEPFFLFIRHGERFDIKPGDMGAGALLTPRGEQQAFDMGQKLKEFAPFRIFSSTVQRCADTGAHMLRGAGIQDKVSVQNFLAEGYIENFQLIMEANNTINFEKILRIYMKEGYYPGLYPLKEGSENLMDNFTKVIKKNESAVFISHDAVIMPFIKYFMGKDLTSEWLNFLSGVLIPQNDPAGMIHIQGVI